MDMSDEAIPRKSMMYRGLHLCPNQTMGCSFHFDRYLRLLLQSRSQMCRRQRDKTAEFVQALGLNEVVDLESG